MFRRLVSVVWMLTASMTMAQAAESIGFRQTVLDQDSARPLPVALWYPTPDQGPTTRIGDNPVLIGTEAQQDARPADHPSPLIVLSHGYGGSWRSVNWLASALATQGYIVAAPDHPGTTTFNQNPAQAAQLAQRPGDLTRLIDALTADPRLTGPVDPQHIAAMGHSLGGWTVAALAGVQVDPTRFASDCPQHPTLWACRFVAQHPLTPATFAQPMHDPRVRAVVTLDLGLARGFTPQSLAALHTPMLVMAADIDVGDMPAALESGYLIQHLPPTTARYVGIPDAMHFSFMQRCKPGAPAILAADRPGDDILCKDGGTRSREDIHADITQHVTRFLTETLSSSP